jgi:hypothetical protein
VTAVRWTAAALALLLLPGSALADDRAAALGRYHGLLIKICPKKHLELLPDSTLRAFQGNFIDRLPHAQHLALADIANRDASCAQNMRDARCVNASFLRATAKTGQLAAFADMMCRLPVACKAGSPCVP